MVVVVMTRVGQCGINSVRYDTLSLAVTRIVLKYLPHIYQNFPKFQLGAFRQNLTIVNIDEIGRLWCVSAQLSSPLPVRVL